MADKLPKKIPEPKLFASQTEMEIGKEIRRYNSLPVGHPGRQAIYDNIQSLTDYSENWD